MKRMLASALTVAVLATGAGTDLEAQVRRASLFDLGLYGGGAWPTTWFSTGTANDNWSVGLNPIFGGTATYWASPSFGIRLHGAYMPTDLPSSGNVEPDGRMNNYLYDLNLVFRPMFWRDPYNFLSSTYVFAGGGGYTGHVRSSNVAIADRCVRQPEWVAGHICVTDDAMYGTNGMGVVGLGWDLVPLGTNFGLFLEAAAHGHNSPAKALPSGGTRENNFVITPRLVLGLKAMFGDILPPPPAPPIAPPPPPPPPPPATPAPATINVCVIEDGMLRNVQAQYNPATGDTMVAGQAFRQAYAATTPPYAAGAAWFIGNEPITFQNRRFVKFGLPRILGVNEVARAGEYQGVPVFAETGMTTRPDVIYVPVRPGCEFQPYQTEVKAGAVRGE